MACVKFRRHLFNAQYPDGRRQLVVQGDEQAIDGNRRLQGYGRDLRQCMHPGIGSPRSLRQHGVSRDPSERFGERALHGRFTGLNLPAMKRMPIVSQRDLEISRHILPAENRTN